MTSILVVDDDDQLRTALARELRELDFDVHMAASVPDAVSILSSEPVDVILTDLRMSEEDGIDLLDRARRLSRNTRAILMSAYASARDHQTAIELGAVRVLCKPFTSTELLQAIQQAVDCETGFRGSVHGLSLVDLLQMFHYARRSITIRLAGVERGAIHLEDGEIVHAEQGPARGEKALRVLLAHPSGSILTEPLESRERSITRSFQSLLLDLLRQLDEHEAEPDLDVVFGGDFAAAAPADGRHGPGGVPDSHLDSIRARMGGLAAGATIALIHSETRAVTLLSGTREPGPDAVEATLQTAAAAARVAPDWMRVECVTGPTALGLVKCRRGDCVTALVQTLLGRYAVVKFRAQMGRLAELV